MIIQDADKNRNQIHFCMDEIVPQEDLLRLIDIEINRFFIYELVEKKYFADHEHPSIDPVVLIRIPLIQYLYEIKRQGR